MEIPQELADLSQRLEQWRNQQTGRQKLPAGFWSEAAALARRHGVTRVANVLRMNVSVLRGKSAARPEKFRNQATEFVELRNFATASQAAPPSECTLEIETARGTLRFRLRMPVSAIAELVRALGS